MLCARVQQCQPHHAPRVALHIAKTEEAAVVVRDEVEPVQSERIRQHADSLDLGVCAPARAPTLRSLTR
jgi:hypothetical protein